MPSSNQRESLISSAVAFLQDPTVAASPLARRLAFLESKGLSPSETDEALRRASNLSISSSSPIAFNGRYHDLKNIERDWRDWFVMGVLGGGVSYFLVKIAQKYLIPALQPPTHTELEEAQRLLENKYDEISGMLQAIRSDAETVKRDVDQQNQVLKETTESIELAIEECLSGEARRDEEIHRIQEQVQSLKESLPQILEKNKEAQTAAILDLQTELKSLKSLLSVRPASASLGPSPHTQTPSPNPGRAPLSFSATGSFGLQPSSSTLSRFTNNPPVGIPPWQLAPPSEDSCGSDNLSGAVARPASPSPPASSTPPSSSPASPPLGKTLENVSVNQLTPATRDSELSSTDNITHPNNPLDDEDDHIINTSYNPIDELPAKSLQHH